MFFAAELVHPSKVVYLVSPWLRDIELFDNTTGAFNDLIPGVPLRQVRLTEVLRFLLTLGTHLVVVIRSRQDDGGVGQALEEIATALDRRHLLSVFECREVHTKGILGDAAALIGSMNITHGGLEKNTELLQFVTNHETLAQIRLAFASAYGG